MELKQENEGDFTPPFSFPRPADRVGNPGKDVSAMLWDANG